MLNEYIGEHLSAFARTRWKLCTVFLKCVPCIAAQCCYCGGQINYILCMPLYCFRETLARKTIADYLVSKLRSQLHHHRLIVSQR